MNIAVIAANGRLGQAFVEQALAAGHHVRAGVHSHNTFQPHANLLVVTCDATSQDQIKELIAGQDVVVSCIGHVKGSPADVQTNATKAIVSAMDRLDMKRFVTVTGTGVRFVGDKIGLVDRFLNFAVGVVDPPRVQDGRDHMNVLQASDLDWTVIRLLKLQNIPAKEFELRNNGPTKWVVGRSEVAKAMLQVIEKNSFIKQSPIIARRTR